MNKHRNSEEAQIAFLRDALSQAYNSLRAFDSKAQIVGIGYIFTLGIITTIGSLNPDRPDFSFVTILIAWLLVVSPIIMFGSVLYPSRKLAPRLREKSKEVKSIFFVSTESINKPGSFDTYLSDIETSDFRFELSYELMKVSALREIKRVRFLRGLITACISLGTIFAAQLVQSMSGFFSV